MTKIFVCREKREGQCDIDCEQLLRRPMEDSEEHELSDRSDGEEERQSIGASSKVVGEKDVEDREAAHREREHPEQPGRFLEARTEGEEHQELRRDSVGHRRNGTETNRDEKALHEHVPALPPSRFPSSDLGEQYENDRSRQIEDDAADQGRTAVETGIVVGESSLRDDDIDGRERGDRKHPDHCGNEVRRDLASLERDSDHASLGSASCVGERAAGQLRRSLR